MSILADTNILLRRTQPDHPSHNLAVESVARLLSLCTRPTANNGLGFSVALQSSYCGRGMWLMPVRE